MQLLIDHKNCLFDALNITKFDADIPIAKFIINLNTELVCNIISFQDSELPSEDVIEKNLVFYIHVNIDGILIKK